MKIQAYGGVNFVEIAVSDVLFQTFSLISKQLFLRKNYAIEMISSVGTSQMHVSLSIFPKDCKPKS